MGDWVGIILLYLLGSLLLIAELFLPAHGLLGLIGLAVVIFGLYESYLLSPVVALGGLIALIIALPVGLIFSVRYWHRTPVGRRISPPNPQLSEQDRLPVADLHTLVGQVGQTLTPLRPVGTCLFNGRRVECTAEGAMIDRGVAVRAVRVVNRTLSVRAVEEPPRSDTPATGT